MVKVNVDEELIEEAKKEFPELVGSNATDIVRILMRKALKNAH